MSKERYKTNPFVFVVFFVLSLLLILFINEALGLELTYDEKLTRDILVYYVFPFLTTAYYAKRSVWMGVNMGLNLRLASFFIDVVLKFLTTQQLVFSSPEINLLLQNGVSWLANPFITIIFLVVVSFIGLYLMAAISRFVWKTILD